jgi:hypothetical protein
VGKTKSETTNVMLSTMRNRKNSGKSKMLFFEFILLKQIAVKNQVNIKLVITIIIVVVGRTLKKETQNHVFWKANKNPIGRRIEPMLNPPRAHLRI